MALSKKIPRELSIKEKIMVIQQIVHTYMYEIAFKNAAPIAANRMLQSKIC